MRNRLTPAALTLLALTACGPMTPQEVARLNTSTLCRFYSEKNNDHNYAVLAAELEKRGETRCMRPEISANIRENTVATALFGPLGGLIHSVARPEPTEGTPESNPTIDGEIAQVRREQAERQRRERIAAMVAQGASDEDIRKALSNAPPN